MMRTPLHMSPCWKEYAQCIFNLIKQEIGLRRSHYAILGRHMEVIVRMDCCIDESMIRPDCW